MNGLIVGALVALSLPQQKTDTVFPVQDAKTIEVSAGGGTITVTGWDRNEVRIQADHSLRTVVHIRRSRDGDRIRVGSEARRGPGGIVDYRISVPRTLALDLEGTYTDITVDSVNAAVSAETMRGDVSVRGGRGSIKASTTIGKLLVDGAQGRIDATTAAASIRFVNVAGDVTAESAGGDIVFENARATSVDVGTTAGRIRYEGSLVKTGTYLFGTYGGSVTLVLPAGTPASLSLSSIHGMVMTNMNGEMQRFREGEHHNFDVGSGGATVQVETYGGLVAVLRKGTEGSVGGDMRVDPRDEVDVRDGFAPGSPW